MHSREFLYRTKVIKDSNSIKDMQNIYNNYRDMGLFNNGDYLVYSFKKTEKIVSAIYLVTSLLKDSEPMKWELREGSMSLLSVIMTLNSSELADKNRHLQSFFTLAIQVISFLNIAYISGIISNMNSSILITEITSLVDYVKQQTLISSNASGFILSDSFFATDMSLPKVEKTVISDSMTTVSATTLSTKADMIKDKKDTRKNSILTILKKDSNLTIKDFVKVITDCSEKTIQRELIDLVEKGLVKKNGERRWSTYSLA